MEKVIEKIGLLEKKAKITVHHFALLVILSLLPLFEGGIDHRATNWVLFMALVAALWLIAGKKVTLDQKSTWPFIMFGLFFLWSGVSIFWSIAPHRTMVEFLQLGLYGTVLFLAYFLNKGAYFRIGKVILVAGVLLAILGILQNVILGDTTITSTFTHHNPFGIYMVILFLCAWDYYIGHENKVFFIASIFLLIGLFMSGSRGALVALFIALPLLLPVLPFERKAITGFLIKTTACMLIAFLLASLIMALPPLRLDEEREAQIAGILGRPDYLKTQNVFARFSYWNVGYQVLQMEPVLGFGLGTFSDSYVLAETWPRMHYSRFAHNHYLQSFVETGFIGFLLFTGFFGSLLVFFKKNISVKNISSTYPGLLAALLAFLVHIGIDFTWNFPAASLPFFFLLGLLLGQGSINCDINEKKSFNTRHRSLLLMVVILLVLANTWYVSAFYFYNRAIKAELEGNPSQALKYYGTVNRYYPINARAFYFSSDNHLALYKETGNEEHLENAVDDITKAVELNPFDPTIRLAFSNILETKGDDKKALEQQYISYKHSSNYLPRLANAAKQYYEDGNLASSKNTSKKALKQAEFALNVTSGTKDQEFILKSIINVCLILVNIYETEGNTGKVEKYQKYADGFKAQMN